MIEVGHYELIQNKVENNLGQVSLKVGEICSQACGLSIIVLSLFYLGYEQVLCMKLLLWLHCTCPKGVKTFLLSLRKTPPAVIRLGEILWVRLLASVRYSGTIPLSLFFWNSRLLASTSQTTIPYPQLRLHYCFCTGSIKMRCMREKILRVFVCTGCV